MVVKADLVAHDSIKLAKVKSNTNLESVVLF